MLQWTRDGPERSYLEEDLTKACMRAKGFELVPLPSKR